jgi:hypothetical protein
MQKSSLFKTILMISALAFLLTGLSSQAFAEKN